MLYYIIDANDQRQGGPYSEQQLQTLADQGVITQMTRLERNDGRKGRAEQIPGLRFIIAPPPPPEFDAEESEDDTDELPATLILLWVGFGCSCVLAVVGLFVWIVLSVIALPVAIVLLVLAIKERIRNIERELENRARQGDIRAMYDLACKHESKGKYDDAVHWFTNAAKKGHAGAQYDLGQLYLKGKRNLAQAVHWFQKAADQGLAVAQYTLGYCYMTGCGTAKDAVSASEWFKKAADQGHEKAKYEYERPERERREREKQEAERQWRAEENRRRLNEMLENSPELRKSYEKMKEMFRDMYR